MKILENCWVKLILNLLITGGVGLVAHEVIMLHVNDHLGLLSSILILLSLIITLGTFYEGKK